MPNREDCGGYPFEWMLRVEPVSWVDHACVTPTALSDKEKKLRIWAGYSAVGYRRECEGESWQCRGRTGKSRLKNKSQFLVACLRQQFSSWKAGRPVREPGMKKRLSCARGHKQAWLGVGSATGEQSVRFGSWNRMAALKLN